MVMDEVIISSPYEPDNCKANASAAATLARVKKVVRLFVSFFVLCRSNNPWVAGEGPSALIVHSLIIASILFFFPL